MLISIIMKYIVCFMFAQNPFVFIVCMVTSVEPDQQASLEAN